MSVAVHLSPSVSESPAYVVARVEVDSAVKTEFMILVGDGAITPPWVNADARITVGDNYFSPWSVTIPQGGTVVWTLTGENPHIVDFYPTPPSEVRVWILSGTPNINGNGQWAATITRVGDYHYVCYTVPDRPGAHPQHDGWVYVR